MQTTWKSSMKQLGETNCIQCFAIVTALVGTAQPIWKSARQDTARKLETKWQYDACWNSRSPTASPFWCLPHSAGSPPSKPASSSRTRSLTFSPPLYHTIIRLIYLSGRTYNLSKLGSAQRRYFWRKFRKLMRRS